MGNSAAPDPLSSYGIKPHQLSGWDKFKNFMSGAGEKVGLKTHLITPEDYVWKWRPGITEE
jgi:hypothetical protein